MGGRRVGEGGGGGKQLGSSSTCRGERLGLCMLGGSTERSNHAMHVASHSAFFRAFTHQRLEDRDGLGELLERVKGGAEVVPSSHHVRRELERAAVDRDCLRGRAGR